MHLCSAPPNVGGALHGDVMTKTLLSIDRILHDFFGAKLAHAKGLTRTRIEEVERHLRVCLEAEAPRILVSRDLVILAAEREFGHEGAVARTMSASDLIFVLPLFTVAPWLPDDVVQRRVHLTLVDALTANVIGRRLIDPDELCCPLLDLRYALDSGRAKLRMERKQMAAERATLR